MAPVLAMPRFIQRTFTAFKARVSARIVALTVPSWGHAEYFEHTFANYVKEGYKRNEIIYACINATSRTAASVALIVHQAKDDLALPDSDLQKLLKRPNPMMTEYEYWIWTITFLMLAGVSYWQKIRDGSGRVIEMWPIRPDYVRPAISDQAGLTEYRIWMNGIEIETIPARDMVIFKLPDPMDLFGRQSPLEIIARTADVDNSLTDLLKVLMQRGAMPMGILTTKQRLTDDAAADIRRRWEERYSGYNNWTSPAVLDSEATYQRTGMTMNEMHFSELDGRAETRICMVYQIPPILIGATFGLQRSTFSNYQEARRQWWEDSLSALYKQFADGIQNQLVPDFEDDVIVKWDFSKVPALQDERDARWTRALAAVEKGVITVNMGLKEMGLPTVGKEGDVFLRSSSTVAVPNNAADDELSTTGDVSTNAADEQAQRDELRAAVQGKALTTISAEAIVPVKIIGAPLPTKKATAVDPFKQAEIDRMFEMYKTLKNGKHAGVVA